MKRMIIAALAAATLLTGCDVNDADVVSANVSKAAANFEVPRRIVFYNIRTNTYMLSIDGLCARENKGQEVEITCKTGPGQNDYKKHFMGLTTEVTYFIEQTEATKADKYFYRVTFKPSVILPDVDIR
ncbi:site-specific recombination directionality factor RDF [Pantoea phage vB_PagM_LIET2]|uniref:Lipoprotein n=1 Tax=Pantoea phage vB_PagM_LIET2 TaxID=2508071 RepID=A0A411AVY9_9CAUD|nr:site-specific recombination directionality factor RDF [Pantoea phage vB_PagM_LIET2]QAX92272.1 hypothetical protein LIET2_gp020 [Pantoea phage vB_PagM_LIET2]